MLITMIMTLMKLTVSNRADVKSCAGECKNRVYCRTFGFRSLAFFICRPFFIPMHYRLCSCSVYHGKDLFVATITLSESEFLGENCHLSELAEEGEEENQLKVS